MRISDWSSDVCSSDLYGNVARFLGHYVRDRGLMPLAEGIHRLTGLPAANWKLADRGCLEPGCFADIVVFDPATIADHATYRSEEHTSELQSLMRISYAVVCLKKKNRQHAVIGDHVTASAQLLSVTIDHLADLFDDEVYV